MCTCNEWWNCFESKLELVGLIQVAAPWCGLAHFCIVDKEDDGVDIGHDLIITDPNETSGVCIGGFNVNEKLCKLTAPKRTR